MEDLRDILQRLGERATSEGFRDEPDEYDIDGGTGCTECGGRGWYTPNVPVGHPEFGQTVTCRCLETRLTDSRQARLVRYSNLGVLTRYTFESLDRDGRSEGIEGVDRFRIAYDAAVEYASRPEGWLVLTGPHGTGKTHLAAAVSNRLIQNGYSVFFVHIPELLDHLRSAYSPASETTYDELFEQVKNTPILVMDELYSGNATPWSQEKLRQLTNHRCNGQLPTIITTALPPIEADPYIRVRLESESRGNTFQLGKIESVHSSQYGSIAPEMLRQFSFSTFNLYSDLSLQERDSLEGALTFARNYASEPQGWLTLYGSTGTGKTHLAVAIAGEQIKQGNPVTFAFVPELMDRLRHAFEPGSGISYMRLLEDVKNAPLLILDDLGRESDSTWSDAVLFQIIVHRHNLRLPTVTTCNEDLPNGTGPVGSRLRDPAIGFAFPLHLRDYRTRGRSGG